MTPSGQTLSDYLRALPKAELHRHLEGSLRPELRLRLAERNRVRLPFSHPDDFPSLCRFRSFRDFADLLLLGVRCLRQPEDFHDAVLDVCAVMAAENIRYAEITWTPQFYLNRGHPLDALLAAMNAARAEARNSWGIELRWIPDLVRSDPAPARLIAAWACSPSARAGGVVALGLGGPEKGHPANAFAPCFAQARARGLPANPHAGEGMGADSVRDTLAHLRPARLGHGVRAAEDPALVEALAASRMPLEVCLTSNIRLGVYADYAAHPVNYLIEAGCNVIFNTDDPVLFQTSLSEEYRHAIEDCGLSLDAIEGSILAARARAISRLRSGRPCSLFSCKNLDVSKAARRLGARQRRVIPSCFPLPGGFGAAQPVDEKTRFLVGSGLEFFCPAVPGRGTARWYALAPQGWLRR